MTHLFSTAPHIPDLVRVPIRAAVFRMVQLHGYLMRLTETLSSLPLGGPSGRGRIKPPAGGVHLRLHGGEVGPANGDHRILAMDEAFEGNGDGRFVEGLRYRSGRLDATHERREAAGG